MQQHLRFRGLIWALPLWLAFLVQNLNAWREYYWTLALLIIFATPLLIATRTEYAENFRDAKFSSFAMATYLLVIAINPLFSAVPYFSEAGAAFCILLPLSFFAYLSTLRFQSEVFRLDQFWIWLIASGLSVFGLYENVMMRRRAHGPYHDVNTLAALLNLAAIPLISRCVAGDIKKYHWVLLGLLATGLATANSKGAYLSLVIALIAIVFIQRDVLGSRTRAIKSFMILLLPFVVLSSTHGAHRNYGTEQAPSIMARIWIWKAALTAYGTEAPFFGTGLNTYKLLYAHYRDPREIFSSGDQAHNDYVQWLLEGGPALLIALLLVSPGLAIVSLKRAAGTQHITPQKREEIVGLAGACLALSIHASVNFIYKTPILLVIAGLYLGRVVELQRSHFVISSETNRRDGFNLLFFSPSVIALGMFGVIARDGLIRWLTDGSPAPISKYFPSNTDRVAAHLSILSPSNPYPKIFLSERFLDAAKAESDPISRHTDLAEASRITYSWLNYDRFEAGAWLRLADISTIDKGATGGTPPVIFLKIALSYRPANFWVRNRLIKELTVEGETGAACGVAREGIPWMAGTPLLLKQELSYWASAGKTLCSPSAEVAELEFWSQVARKFPVD